jgi:hypothetical protein
VTAAPIIAMLDGSHTCSALGVTARVPTPSRHGQPVSSARRVLQEVAAARCRAEARHIMEQTQTEIDKMEPLAKERLLLKLQDLIVELPH